MSDLISRQAAIDAMGKAKWAKERLMELPSVQPEIIRCKDCRHNQDCDIQYDAQAGEEFYCGAAERRLDA